MSGEAFIPKKKNVLSWYTASFFLTLLMHSAYALTFALPTAGNNIVGEINIIKVQPGDNLQQVARQYDLSYEELLAANPNVSEGKLKANTKLVIPSAFILPEPRQGIVINLAEMRLYFFLPQQNVVMTYPIGVGREGWETPLSQSTVEKKVIGPTWVVPPSVHGYVLETKGKELPEKVPPGPDNPLGDYAIYLTLKGYLIHGTNQPKSVGQRSSSGCVRLYPQDIAEFFPYVSIGTPVYIIHAPFKLGQFSNELYFEAHRPLTTYATASLVDVLGSVFNTKKSTINWDQLTAVVTTYPGYPVLIGQKN